LTVLKEAQRLILKSGELRSREYESKKKDSRQRVWEIRVASILKLDRAEKAAPEDQDTRIRPRRKRPHRPLLFTWKLS